MKINGKDYRTVWWEEGSIHMINQPLLPHKFEIVQLHDYKQVYDAIKTMIVRGAPAIGATAAYGLAQAMKQGHDEKKIYHYLLEARPTAHDLKDGLDYVMSHLEEPVEAAKEYADKGAEACRMIGEHGAQLIETGDSILTHCNAGALATVDFGTALAPIRIAHSDGKKIFVFVDETRPRQQGSRLTAYELAQEEIPHAVIADNAAGHFMHIGKIQLCIVGADRIAMNGDIANKIGTYEKAVLAKENNIPFYVAAPMSTFDKACRCGDNIPIEEREDHEVLFSSGWLDGKFVRVRTSPEASKALNPAFDITPAKYITGYITPKGIFKAGDLAKLFN